MANNLHTITTVDTSPFKKLVMTIGELPTSFVESMTYYECLAWLVHYIQNTVIPAVNGNAEATAELQTKFIELKNYVDDYFDNLNVQQEINNKLDQMVSTGELQVLLSQQYDELKTEVENEIDETKSYLLNNLESLNTKVDRLSSTSPLVASSTAGMTDTSRIYVNTTDGKWYYYDGDSWKIGGTYQSTGIGESSVGLNSLDNNLKDAIFKTGDVSSLSWSYYGYHPTHVRRYSNLIFFKKGSTITPSESFLTKYDWYIATLSQPGVMINITSTPTMTSYTFTQDMVCCIRVDVKNGYWGDEDHPYGVEFTSDDLVFTYYYPIINNNKNLLLDLDPSELANQFFPATFMGDSKQFATSGSRVSICKIHKSNYPIYIKIKNGYQLAIQTWSNNSIVAENLVSNSGWITDKDYYLMPANTYFTISYRKSDNSTFDTNFNFGSIVTFTSYPNYTYLDDKIIEAVAYQDSGDYSYYGQDLNMKIKRTFNVEKLMDTIVTTSSSQAFDIYDNYLIQFYGDGITQVLNHSTKSEVGVVDNLYNLLGHCGACQFTPNFYDNSDLLPIINVSSQSYPATVAQVRIQTATLSGGSILKKYKLSNQDGYWSVQCCDFDRKIMYSIGYKQNSYSSSINNSLIFSSYDMTQESVNSDGTYSLALIERYELPYQYCIQSAKFLNDNIYLVSSLESSVHHTKILVFNPDQKKYISSFEDLPNELALEETEDVAFIPGIKFYKMVVGTRDLYDLIEFV